MTKRLRYMGPAAERLEKRLAPGPNGCLEFTGYRSPKGYGSIWVPPKLWPAHRFAWVLANGPVAVGFLVCHTCDNPPCCNVDHLFLGTPQDNTQDMIRKGRHVALYGTSNGKTRLSDADVLAIRAAVAAGTNTRDVAEQFGTSANYVDHLVKLRRRPLVDQP